jgi:hypothetical protein
MYLPVPCKMVGDTWVARDVDTDVLQPGAYDKRTCLSHVSGRSASSTLVPVYGYWELA